jgi:hypothetical protein
MGVISSLKISGKGPESHLTQPRPISPSPHAPPPLAAPFLRSLRLRAGPLLGLCLHARRRYLFAKRDPTDASAAMRAQTRPFPPFLAGGRGVCPGIFCWLITPQCHKSPRGSGNGPCTHTRNSRQTPISPSLLSLPPGMATYEPSINGWVIKDPSSSPSPLSSPARLLPATSPNRPRLPPPHATYASPSSSLPSSALHHSASNIYQVPVPSPPRGKTGMEGDARTLQVLQEQVRFGV